MNMGAHTAQRRYWKEVASRLPTRAEQEAACAAWKSGDPGSLAVAQAQADQVNASQPASEALERRASGSVTCMTITEMQIHTMQAIDTEMRREGVLNVDTVWVNQRLYHMLRRSRGDMWASQSECAQGHISALVKKGLAERPCRGQVTLTELGQAELAKARAARPDAVTA